MNKKNIITILFPAIIMTLITVIPFNNMSSHKKFDFDGFFIISLVFLFPLLFLIQGIISALNNTSILISLGLSILDFFILLIIYLNDTALIYIARFLILGLLGFIITKFIKKILKS